MVKPKDNLDEIIKQFEKCTTNPTAFLSTQLKLEADVKKQLKSLYDFTKKLESNPDTNHFSVPKLVINSFDCEQVWQQIDIQNQHVLDALQVKLADYSEDVTFIDENEPADDESSVDEDKNENSENENLSLGSDNEDIGSLEGASEGSEIEDAEEEDDGEIDNDSYEEKTEDDNEELNEDEIDDFNDNDSDESSDDKLTRKETKKTVRFNLDEHSPETEEKSPKKADYGPKSSFEERQERLQKRIEKLETDALAEKPWQLKGEVSSKTRPQNSLLEEILEFDLTSRPAPIITEDAAMKLEDIILRRIKDRAWDDVEKKIKPIDTPFEFKKKLVLNQEKSKLSLAKIYEQEYLKQKDAADPENKYKKEEEPKEHKHIREMLDHLFRTLDSLSNYHYTPLPSAPELKIVNNLPAISIEEAIPAAVSDAALLAPEEIQEKRTGDLISKDERTDTDKKRSRRKKKLKQKVKAKEIKARQNYLQKTKPSSSNKHGREKMKQELEKLSKHANVSHFQEAESGAKASKSSKQFFSQLQDTVTSTNKLKRKKEIVKHDAKKLKL